MTVHGCLQVVSTLLNAAFTLHVSVSVYIVTRHTAAHPSSKTFYGCLHGRRAAVMRTRMEREDRMMWQQRKYITVVWPWKRSLTWSSYTPVWQGGFALNWVTREHTHTWNSKKEHALSYTHTHMHTHRLWFCSHEWVGCDRAGNMTQVKENISLGYFRCSKRASLKCVRMKMQVCVCALVMENIHCDVL